MNATNTEAKDVKLRDPVCGMKVNSTALRVDTHPELGFCSEHCRSRFLADPERYVAATAADDTPGTLPRRAEASGAIHLSVDGMTCASCVSTVESALKSVPGVIDARVNFAASTATVDTGFQVPIASC
jgi:YHS domain-containing protein